MLYLLSLLFCLFASLHAGVCLNMVIRDDVKNISTCLSSVKPFIDYWVIVDAGSSEETGKRVREILKDIPGELYFRRWSNPKEMLNTALDLAKGKGDYLLMIQPTEQFRAPPEFNLSSLEKDCYFIKVTEADVDFQRIFLVSTKLHWYWKGSLYPTLLSEEEGNFDLITNAQIVSAKTDAQILEESLEQDPTNAGLVFRLAQAYSGEKEYAKAKEYYQRRVKLGGWGQEMFWSLYQLGNMSQLLNADPCEVIENYYRAHHYNPLRAEPLYRLAGYYYTQEKYCAAYAVLQQALALPFPYDDRYFLEQWIYDYGLLTSLSDCCWALGDYPAAMAACKRLLAKDNVPPEVKRSVEKNMGILESMGVK